jgi:hypothetical protein
MAQKPDVKQGVQGYDVTGSMACVASGQRFL